MEQQPNYTDQYGVVLVTAPSVAEAEAIAQALVQEGLAACVSLMPIRSIYTWQGQLNKDEEWQLVIKTNLNRFTALEARIRQLHSYEVPEIIALPILYGSQHYLSWIAEQTRSSRLGAGGTADGAGAANIDRSGVANTGATDDSGAVDAGNAGGTVTAAGEMGAKATSLQAAGITSARHVSHISAAAPLVLSYRFNDAFLYAAELHVNQFRKGTNIPYIAHLMAVCSLALEHGATENEAIAALLHDAVEDQGGAATREEIRRRFGNEVAAIVDGCTDADGTPKPPWKERKQRYLDHLPHASASVRLVSICDKLHNARSILNDYRIHGEAVWERFQGGKEGTLWYYRSLVDIFQRLGRTPLVEELDRVVVELEKVAHRD